VLVTGASAGLGEHLAREAAKAGARVVLVARRMDRLAMLAAELGRHRAVDVAADVRHDGDLERAVEVANRTFGPVDVLIANAGFSVGGPLECLSVGDYARQFETNFFGVLRTIYAALPDLKRTRGAIGIVGSANGFLALPGWSAYCTSKFALRGLAESLRAELAPQGIAVTHFAPGFVATEFRTVDESGQHTRKDPIPRFIQASPDRAARRMLRALTSNRRELVLTGHARLGVALSRHAPRITAAALRAAASSLTRASRR